MRLPRDIFHIHPEVDEALKKNLPVLALESTIIAHGMPYPENLEFAQRAESTARDEGAVPVTIAIINGRIHVGMGPNDLEIIARGEEVAKITARDLSVIISQGGIGATTVSATVAIANLVGINVLATGGIGGVHRKAENTFDISQDLQVLSKTPVVIVSSGVKAILDIPKTLEYLETNAITVVGYQTREFPAFYSRKSDYSLETKMDSPEEIARAFRVQTGLGIRSAFLVANPIPKSAAIPSGEMQEYINQTLRDCEKKGITGKATTPFLLHRINDLTGGKTLTSNIALALNNVLLGARIARAIQEISL